jgi:hypothetical protein
MAAPASLAVAGPQRAGRASRHLGKDKTMDIEPDKDQRKSPMGCRTWQTPTLYLKTHNFH